MLYKQDATTALVYDWHRKRDRDRVFAYSSPNLLPRIPDKGRLSHVYVRSVKTNISLLFEIVRWNLLKRETDAYASMPNPRAVQGFTTRFCYNSVK